ALLDDPHGVVEDPLGDGLLPVDHEVVHKLRDRLGRINRIRRDRALDGACAATHDLLTLSGGPARLRLLRSVLRTALTTIVHASGVQRAPYDVVANTRQVLHSTAPNQDDGVL